MMLLTLASSVAVGVCVSRRRFRLGSAARRGASRTKRKGFVTRNSLIGQRTCGGISKFPNKQHGGLTIRFLFLLWWRQLRHEAAYRNSGGQPRAAEARYCVHAYAGVRVRCFSAISFSCLPRKATVRYTAAAVASVVAVETWGWSTTWPEQMRKIIL